MQGKVCLVTGGTSGIGRATALGLARLGATVAIVGRDPDRLAESCAAIAKATGNSRIEPFIADLSAQIQVRMLAESVLERFDRLDVLVNNAGAVFDRRIETEDGLESTFALNHLAYFLLTDLLLDRLKASAPARIVNVASDVQAFSRMRWDDLQFEHHYEIMAAYGQSKLANLLFTFELARRLEGTGVTANCVHPGVVATRLGRDAGGLFGLFARLSRPLSLSPEKGARTVLYLASSNEVLGASGGYYAKCRPSKASQDARDPEQARRLWEASEALVRRRGGFRGSYRPSGR